MMEPFRDRDDFADKRCNYKIVHNNDFVDYKRISGNSKFLVVYISNFGRHGFNSIIKSNVNKASIELFGKKIYLIMIVY